MPNAKAGRHVCPTACLHVHTCYSKHVDICVKVGVSRDTEQFVENEDVLLTGRGRCWEDDGRSGAASASMFTRESDGDVDGGL